MIRWRAWMVVLLFVTGSCSRPVTFSVPRADVTLRVRPEGAIDVHEVLTVRFGGAGEPRFERRIPLQRAESLTFESATLDGRPLEPGRAGATTLEVDDDDGLVVAWTFPSASGATHVLALSYRANGAVAIRGARGSIQHVAVPADRGYAIEHASVRLAVEPDVHVFDGAGIAEADWTVLRTRDGIAGERRDLLARDGATVMAEISIDPAVVAEPAWQRYEEWAADLVPAFVSGGLFILVIGGGVLWIIRFQYPRRRIGSPPLADQEERDRRAVRSGLRTSGLVAIVLAVVLAVVTWLTLSHFGWWPMSLPIAILVVGVVFLAIARHYV